MRMRLSAKWRRKSNRRVAVAAMAVALMVALSCSGGESDRVAGDPRHPAPAAAASGPSPTSAPEPTAAPGPWPTSALDPTAAPDPPPTSAPEPTAAPDPPSTSAPVPTSAPEPTAAPGPSPTSVPEPTAAPGPSPTSAPEPTAAPSTSMQPHVILRVVLVTEDWVPFSSAGGWTQAVPTRESRILRYYEAAIWEETDSVHLYAFPNDYNPYYGASEGLAEDDVAAYREQYALSVYRGMPGESSDERSEFLRRAFEGFAAILAERHPRAEHHLMYNGHGGPGGELFAGQMSREHADGFLGHWTGLLGRPLGVIDMGGPCNKGGYEDLANFCRHARYYVASDLPNGGYNMDEWTPEKYDETDAETQYHRLFSSNDTLEAVLVGRVELRRKHYEYSRGNQTRGAVAQANYVYSCAGFHDFGAAFESFLAETAIPHPTHDLYQLLLDNSAPTELLGLFRQVFAHRVDNRDFFRWDFPANGMISPLDRIYRQGRPQ